jgi:hypothetical protein
MAGLMQESLASSSQDPEGPEAGPDKEIAGRSPMKIAFARLRRDKVAIVCFVIVVFFVLIAVFAGKFWGVS